MPRVRPLSKDDAPPEVRDVLAEQERLRGRVLTSSGIRAYCPPIFHAARALGSAPAQSGKLSDQLRALVQLRAAQMVRCPF